MIKNIHDFFLYTVYRISGYSYVARKMPLRRSRRLDRHVFISDIENYCIILPVIVSRIEISCEFHKRCFLLHRHLCDIIYMVKCIGRRGNRKKNLETRLAIASGFSFGRDSTGIEGGFTGRHRRSWQSTYVLWQG